MTLVSIPTLYVTISRSNLNSFVWSFQFCHSVQVKGLDGDTLNAALQSLITKCLHEECFFILPKMIEWKITISIFYFLYLKQSAIKCTLHYCTWKNTSSQKNRTHLLYLFITNGAETILRHLAAERLRAKLFPPSWKLIHFKFLVHFYYPLSLKF